MYMANCKFCDQPVKYGAGTAYLPIITVRPYPTDPDKTGVK